MPLAVHAEPLNSAPLPATNSTGTISNNAPIKSFKDCADCPDMVIVPAGSYVMGSPPTEVGRGEEMQHKIIIEHPFAVGKFEVTFDQWDACVAAKGCITVPSDEGWGRGTRPVINVSWWDAKKYVGWLKQKTGQEYRLLSEAEWEYAARAGSTTSRFWGDDWSQACKYANVYDKEGYGAVKFTWPAHPCSDGFANTAPVGSFPPNAFGLHDMLGNVWEWVEDCWLAEYPSFSATGKALHSGDCGKGILRGGSWSFDSASIRSARRYWNYRGEGESDYGLRVAKTLPP